MLAPVLKVQALKESARYLVTVPDGLSMMQVEIVKKTLAENGVQAVVVSESTKFYHLEPQAA